MTDSSALTSVISELVNTERNYVRRIRTLKHEYADPLRSFARSKDTAIIPAYEAKTLFGNIDALVPVNEAFLADLEQMLSPDGPATVGGIGDVALRHFRELRGFEQYKQYYIKREEAQTIFEREMARKSSSFAQFVDVCALALFMLPVVANPCTVCYSASSTQMLTLRIELGSASFSWTPSSAYPGIPSCSAP
jgi:hypothetical protein